MALGKTTFKGAEIIANNLSYVKPTEIPILWHSLTLFQVASVDAHYLRETDGFTCPSKHNEWLVSFLEMKMSLFKNTRIYTRGLEYGMSLIFGNIKDYSKRILWLPELMLKLIFMWPEKNTIQLTSTFIFWGFLNMFVLWGQITYSYMNYKDYNKSLTVVSSMSTLFQSTLKMLMLTYHAAPLREILSNISTKFWPCRILPDHLEEYKSSYRNGLGAMLSLTCSGMFFSVASLVVPLLSANRELPFRSLYPFDCSVSPIYEMIYILHCFINAYLVNWAVLGFDFLFMGICRNIVSQYTLLQKAFLQLGTEKEKYLNKKLRSLNIDLIVNGNLQANGNSTLLVKLIQLHQLLLKTTKNVENVFNLMAACQLCSSIVAICVSGFISTRENVSKVQVITMTSYLVGHLIQLYLYCATGNELLYVSNNLTQQIFASNWYEIEDVNVQKDIIFVIKNAQIPAKITAFKVFTLNYATYIKVLRLSFSFYTLLSSMINK